MRAMSSAVLAWDNAKRMSAVRSIGISVAIGGVGIVGGSVGGGVDGGVVGVGVTWGVVGGTVGDGVVYGIVGGAVGGGVSGTYASGADVSVGAVCAKTVAGVVISGSGSSSDSSITWGCNAMGSGVLVILTESGVVTSTTDVGSDVCAVWNAIT